MSLPRIRILMLAMQPRPAIIPIYIAMIPPPFLVHLLAMMPPRAIDVVIRMLLIRPRRGRVVRGRPDLARIVPRGRRPRRAVVHAAVGGARVVHGRARRAIAQVLVGGAHDRVALRVGVRGGGVAVAGGLGAACGARGRAVVVGRAAVGVGHRGRGRRLG